jgi:hypothetical protein
VIADHLGDYQVDQAAVATPGLPRVVLRPVDGTGSTILAAHLFPPLPSQMGTWRAGQQWVADKCDSPDLIVAGDLNATVDHLWGLGDGDGLIGPSEDAFVSAGAAAVGTLAGLRTALASVPDRSRLDRVGVEGARSVCGHVLR